MLFCAEVDMFRRRYAVPSGTNMRSQDVCGDGDGMLERGAGGGKIGSALHGSTGAGRRNLVIERTALALRESEEQRTAVAAAAAAKAASLVAGAHKSDIHSGSVLGSGSSGPQPGSLDLQRAHTEALKIYEKYVEPGWAKLDVNAEPESASRIKRQIDQHSGAAGNQGLALLAFVFDGLAQQRHAFVAGELWRDFQGSAVLKAWHAKIRSRIRQYHPQTIAQ